MATPHHEHVDPSPATPHHDPTAHAPHAPTTHHAHPMAHTSTHHKAASTPNPNPLQLPSLCGLQTHHSTCALATTSAHCLPFCAHTALGLHKPGGALGLLASLPPQDPRDPQPQPTPSTLTCPPSMCTLHGPCTATEARPLIWSRTARNAAPNKTLHCTSVEHCTRQARGG
jgi:hypothetical protein